MKVIEAIDNFQRDIADPSKRILLKATGALLLAGLLGLDLVAMLREDWERGPKFYGRLLDLTGPNPTFTDLPKTFQVEFTPSNSGIDNRPELVFFQHLSLTNPQVRLAPEQVAAKFAAPILGRRYSGHPNGDLRVDFEGKPREGGLWLMITDENGNPVNPYGEKIDLQKETPYYTTSALRDLRKK